MICSYLTQLCLKAYGCAKSFNSGRKGFKETCIRKLVESITEVLKYIAVEIWVMKHLGKWRNAGNCTGLCAWYQMTKNLNLNCLGSLSTQALVCFPVGIVTHHNLKTCSEARPAPCQPRDPFCIEIQGLGWEQGAVLALPAADLAPVVAGSVLTLLCARTVGGKEHPCPVTLASSQSTFHVVMQREN